jgi:membrane-associated phospholipid phosphatase
MDILGIWYAITLLGTPEYWAVFALILAATYFILRYSIPENPSWKRFRPSLKRFLMVFIPSILLVFGATLLIKNLWYVPRPCTLCILSPGSCNPYCDTDSSFPSGHAGTIFVVFSSLYLSTRKRLTIPLFIIPILVSYSRVALGVHTWIDVLGGALLGLILSHLVSVMLQKQHKLK